MRGPTLRRRLQGLLWEHSPPVRRALRRLRLGLSLARHRLRRLVGAAADVRVVSVPAGRLPQPLAVPAIGLTSIEDPGDQESRAPIPQTETSYTRDPSRACGAPFLVADDGGFGGLPATHLEAMLMAAAAEDLDWVVAGWSPPAPGRFGPSGALSRDSRAAEPAHLMVRTPDASRRNRAPVTGRAVPHITAVEACRDRAPLEQAAVVASGPYRLRPETACAPVVEQPLSPLDAVLADLPAVDGPPTALFLLPFLAVGGAERLLFELMVGLGERYRLLVATTDPHLEALGQTVDRARELTTHVYTLGDWLPRDAVGAAIRHLVRRWRVASLVSWNGSVVFFDEVGPLRRRFPHLRIVSQLFNHEGGWIEHTTPSLVRAVDAHIAVNTPIARALVGDRGIPGDRVVTIHHGVGPAAPRDDELRARIRAELGVTDDTVVVGTFIRMHRQKRPLDVVRLARRMTAEKVHFLLVGGGPLDREVDREISRDPPPNLTRRPLHADASPMYAAVDLCLMTSEFEGLPVFLLDGLARGLPCVAPAVGDVPLLLAEGGGEVVEHPGDLDGLAAAVRRLIDPERRRREGELGLRSVTARFGLDRYVEAYEAAIFGPLRGERT